MAEITYNEEFYAAESRARSIIGETRSDVDFGDDGDAPVTLTVNELIELVTKGVLNTPVVPTSTLEISGDDFSARWGAVTDDQINAITNFAEALIGKADTIA